MFTLWDVLLWPVHPSARHNARKKKINPYFEQKKKRKCAALLLRVSKAGVCLWMIRKTAGTYYQK